LPRSLAALAALLGSALVLGGVLAALAPAAIGELNDVDLSVQGGVEEVQEWLSKGPLGLSETRIDELVDRAQDELRARSGTIVGGALGGAVIALEVIAGVLLTIVLLFFFIRDGERLWRWIVGLAREQNRRDVREIGMRAWDTLGGYLREERRSSRFSTPP
jgi:predicted PurR-regulated permease PerM